jgi:hypothetical protein
MRRLARASVGCSLDQVRWQAVTAQKHDEKNLGKVGTIGKPEVDQQQIDAEAFMPIPEDIRKMKTLSIPEGLPRNESMMANHPTTGVVQQWFAVPLFFLLFLAMRCMWNPFNDDDKAPGKIVKEDAGEEHYAMHPERRTNPHEDQDRRKRMREQLQ